jgi:hypothetical protein
MVAGYDGGAVSSRLARWFRHFDLTEAAKITTLTSLAMTLHSPHGSNLNHNAELNRPSLQQRKAWIKPEFRQLDFMATANAGGDGKDGIQPS